MGDDPEPNMPENRSFNQQAMNLIADFQGLPITNTRASMGKDLGLDTIMDRLIVRFQIQGARPEETIAAHWMTIVGERFAQHSFPVRLDRGTRLFVAVSNSVVRQEMWFRRKEILERLKIILKGTEIREIVLRSG
ncbi:MAG: DUF721 domain-containing protein [Opitutae bacterium]|nr:DUF721 domain-containing protein [Opitutae bacterium]